MGHPCASLCTCTCVCSWRPRVPGCLRLQTQAVPRLGQGGGWGGSWKSAWERARGKRIPWKPALGQFPGRSVENRGGSGCPGRRGGSTPTPRLGWGLRPGGRGGGGGLEAPSRPRRWSAQAHSPRAPLAAAPASRILCRSVSAAAASFRPAPPPPCSRRGVRSPRRAPGRAVPCCPGGGAERWRRRSLRPPRGTCGCCGCCSPASSSARPCAVPPAAVRVSQRPRRRPRGAPGPVSPGWASVRAEAPSPSPPPPSP